MAVVALALFHRRWDCLEVWNAAAVQFTSGGLHCSRRNVRCKASVLVNAGDLVLPEWKWPFSNWIAASIWRSHRHGQ